MHLFSLLEVKQSQHITLGYIFVCIFLLTILYLFFAWKNNIFSLFFGFDCAIFLTALMKLMSSLNVRKIERDLCERGR